MLGVSCLECIDLSLVDAVVGGGNSDVGFQIAELKLEVAVSGVLTGDLNVLDGDEHTLLCNKSCIVELGSSGIHLGKVNGSNRLDGAVLDLNGCVDQLVRTAIQILHTGHTNGHTNLDAGSNRIVGQVVDVVAALSVLVLQIESVCAPAVCLGNDTGDDTLYDQSLLVLSGCVLCKGGNLELGNHAVEGNGDAVALCIGDGGNELVCDVSIGLCGNVDGNHLLFVECRNRNAGNVASVDSLDGPGQGVGYALNNQCANELVVSSRCFGLVLVHGVQVILCGGQSIGLFLVIHACHEKREAHSQQKDDRKYLFHKKLLLYY